MNKTTLKIKVLYDKMGKAEKKIADWIIANPGGLIPLSIVELAAVCGCGEATIVRFARRLGFSGYQELKISLAKENKNKTVSTTIAPTDDTFAIFEKVCNDIYCSLEMTKQVLAPESLEQAAEKLAAAQRILIFGLGNSAAIAIDMAHKLLRIGFTAFAYSDNHMQAIAASHLSENDVAIGISHSGSSRDIVEALGLARTHGAATIAITNRGKSPIVKQSDIVLCTAAGETAYSLLALNSRIAQLAIVDCLYFKLIYRKDDCTLHSMEDTEQALQTKKY